MVLTTLAEYGLSVIVGSQGDENIVPALGDGTATPGDFVHIGSDNKVAGALEGAVDLMLGIVEVSDITGAEAAIASGTPCDVVIPKSGHRYNVRILSLGAAKEVGQGLDVSATAGSLDGAASIDVARAVLAKPVANGDTVAQIIWL